MGFIQKYKALSDHVYLRGAPYAMRQCCTVRPCYASATVLYNATEPFNTPL